MTDQLTAASRLAASWLLWYPDDALSERLPDIKRVIPELPVKVRDSLSQFVQSLESTDRLELQRHYVAIFDMKLKASPYLSFWTDGDTRNRGFSILRFKQAYLAEGFEVDDAELPDHLSVVLEFAAVGNTLTGDALLVEHRVAIGLLRAALEKFDSPYIHVVDAVLATLPAMTPEIAERMASLAKQGPPTEMVGLDSFPASLNLAELGGRR
jgi:nitrate reductase delta subunit